MTRRAFLAALAAIGLVTGTRLPPPILDSAGLAVRDEAGNPLRQQ